MLEDMINDVNAGVSEPVTLAPQIPGSDVQAQRYPLNLFRVRSSAASFTVVVVNTLAQTGRRGAVGCVCESAIPGRHPG